MDIFGTRFWGRQPKYRHDPRPFTSALLHIDRLHQPSVPSDPASDLLRILVGAYRGDTIAASSGGSLLGPVAQIADRTWASGVPDRIAYDPDEGWRIHFLGAHPGLVAAMHTVAREESGPGDLSAFDAHDQVRDWLRRIENRIVCPLSDG